MEAVPPLWCQLWFGRPSTSFRGGVRWSRSATSRHEPAWVPGTVSPGPERQPEGQRGHPRPGAGGHGGAGLPAQPAGPAASPGAAARPSGVVVPFFTHASAVERLRGVVAALDGSLYDLVLFNVESPVHRDEHFASLTKRDRADGLLVMSLPPPAGDLARLVDAGCPSSSSTRTATACHGAHRRRRGRSPRHRAPARPRAPRASRSSARTPTTPSGSAPPQSASAATASRWPTAGIAADPRSSRYCPHDQAPSPSGSPASSWPQPTARPRSSPRRTCRPLGVLAAARAAGLRVPEDLSIVGSTTSRWRPTPASPPFASRSSRAGASAPSCCSRRSSRATGRRRRSTTCSGRARRALDAAPPARGPRRARWDPIPPGHRPGRRPGEDRRTREQEAP